MTASSLGDCKTMCDMAASECLSVCILIFLSINLSMACNRYDNGGWNVQDMFGRQPNPFQGQHSKDAHMVWPFGSNESEIRPQVIGNDSQVLQIDTGEGNEVTGNMTWETEGLQDRKQYVGGEDNQEIEMIWKEIEKNILGESPEMEHKLLLNTSGGELGLDPGVDVEGLVDTGKEFGENKTVQDQEMLLDFGLDETKKKAKQGLQLANKTTSETEPTDSGGGEVPHGEDREPEEDGTELGQEDMELTTTNVPLQEHMENAREMNDIFEMTDQNSLQKEIQPNSVGTQGKNVQHHNKKILRRSNVELQNVQKEMLKNKLDEKQKWQEIVNELHKREREVKDKELELREQEKQMRRKDDKQKVLVVVVEKEMVVLERVNARNKTMSASRSRQEEEDRNKIIGAIVQRTRPEYPQRGTLDRRVSTPRKRLVKKMKTALRLMALGFEPSRGLPAATPTALERYQNKDDVQILLI